MRKFICEAIGTLFLVLIGCGVAVATTDLVATSLAFGLTLMLMCYIIGPVSGCHINPAISLSMYLTKKISLKELALYILSQIMGALLGSLLLATLIKTNTLLNNINYKNAEKLYKNKNYEEAYKEYIKLSEEYSKDKKIYKRLIECLTKDYTYKENSKEFKNTYNDYITTYRILANNKELKYLDEKLEEYKNIKAKNNKSKLLLIAILGIFGVHKFIEKKYVLGVIYLLTLGLFGIGVIVDLVNDYAQYEDDKQLDILRYIISIIIIILALIFRVPNFYYFIIVAILFMPIIYSKLLYLIPNIVKIIAIIALCYLGFKTEVVVDSIPLNMVGNWQTKNENTNFVSIKIKRDKSTIKFNDRKDQTGLNEYDSNTKILKIYINATTYYRFKMDKEEDKLCIYNESNTCLISFEREK